MTRSRRRLAALLVLTFVAAACSTGSGASDAPAPTSPAGGSATGSPTDAGATPGPAGTASPGGARLDQAWATADLVDVTTGGTFRIADLVADGKVVFLETMAIWCTNCRAQQEEATLAFDEAARDGVAWIAIDVETSETAEALAAYREQHAFPFTYVVADREFARALVTDFGDIVLSPPSVNIIVVGTDGRVTPMRGHRSADDLRRLAAEHGA